tara:strand:+ start:848 stop:1012 length:165 start_codon:yes stop_codon:yes gene_type:complete
MVEGLKGAVLKGCFAKLLVVLFFLAFLAFHQQKFAQLNELKYGCLKQTVSLLLP